MSGHSPEPWKYSTDVGGRVNIFVDDGRRVTLCHAHLRPEDARRIVACVNACAAIPTEDLEKAAADPIAGMFGRLAGKSVSQRDHAVRALSQLLSVLDDTRRTAVQTHDALEAARSAVATITGVQP